MSFQHVEIRAFGGLQRISDCFYAKANTASPERNRWAAMGFYLEICWREASSRVCKKLCPGLVSHAYYMHSFSHAQQHKQYSELLFAYLES